MAVRHRHGDCLLAWHAWRGKQEADRQALNISSASKIIFVFNWDHPNPVREAQTIANKLGIEFRVSLEKRIAGAESVGKHKTSMLQDVEAGRALEIDALVGSVMELGRLTQTPTPHIDAVYACTRLLANMLRESSGRLAISKTN